MKTKKIPSIIPSPSTQSDDITKHGADPIEKLARELLSEIGENPDREGLIRTPKRVARAWRFLTRGYDQDIDAIINKAIFEEEIDEMVVVGDIDFFSLCEHHLLPFYGKAHVAYIPNGKVIGLSKIPRLVEVFQPPAPAAGTVDATDRRCDRRGDSPPWRRRGHRSPSYVHDDARC